MKPPIIHIIYNPVDKSNSFRTAINRLGSQALSFTIHNVKRLEEKLRLFKPNLSIIFWIHLDKDNTDPDGYPENFALLEELVGKVFKNNIEIPFLTSARLKQYSDNLKRDNIKIDEYNGNHKMKLDGNTIYSTHALRRNSDEKLPEAKSLIELLKHEYKSISNFNYRDPYDWRVGQLEQYIKENELKAIVGELVETTHDNYIFDIISPGHSGAFVLHLKCCDDGSDDDDDYLIKISKNREELNKEYINGINLITKDLPRKIFVGAYPNTNRFIYDWCCLMYHFKKGKLTLRNLLKKECLKKNSNLNIVNLVFEKWKVFEENPKRKIKFKPSLNPYHSSGLEENSNEIKYKGLQIDIQKRFSIYKTIADLEKWFLKHEVNKVVIPEDIIQFKEFLINDEGKYMAIPIAKYSQELTPIAIVHGDFHTANILVDEKDKEVCFIDFANMPNQPIRHALSDVGKLSADLEISVMPEHIIVDNPSNLIEWVKIHNNWLTGKSLNSNNIEIENIYTWNSQILENTVSKNTTLRLSEKETIRQFHMVRLHYFLKALSYQHECREKLVFFLRASIDILKFLTQASKS